MALARFFRSSPLGGLCAVLLLVLALQVGPVDPASVVNDALVIARMDLLFRLRRVSIGVPAELPPLRAVHGERLVKIDLVERLIRRRAHQGHDAVTERRFRHSESSTPFRGE